MDLDKQWKQLFVNILLENIKNSSNKLFSFHMTSPANDREEPRMPTQASGWGRLRALLAAGSTVLHSLAQEHLLPSWHLSHTEPGWEELPVHGLNWRQTPAVLRERYFSALAKPDNSQPNSATFHKHVWWSLPSWMSPEFGFFFFVLGKSLWPLAVWAWARWCSHPSYWWTLGRAVKWRSSRSCH